MERTRQAGLLCPDGKHSVRTTHTASEGLRALRPEMLVHISRMLCEIAELAAISPFSGWDDSSLLRLHAGPVLILYSLDPDANLIVHHVIDSGARSMQGTG
ncbi:MAG TPA: hypothetical protein VF993_12980 [Myxococcales bacterium]